jgi:hypothetical protein
MRRAYFDILRRVAIHRPRSLLWPIRNTLSGISREARPHIAPRTACWALRSGTLPPAILSMLQAARLQQ